MVTNGFSMMAWHTKVTFESKLEIFIVISFFQFAFSVIGVFCLIAQIYISLYKISKYKN